MMATYRVVMREQYEQDPIIFNMESDTGVAPTAAEAQTYYSENIERYFGNSAEAPTVSHQSVLLESIELMF